MKVALPSGTAPGLTAEGMANEILSGEGARLAFFLFGEAPRVFIIIEGSCSTLASSASANYRTLGSFMGPRGPLVAKFKIFPSRSEVKRTSHASSSAGREK